MGISLNDSNYANKFNKFWISVRLQHNNDIFSLLEEAAKILDRPIISKSFYSNNSFYSSNNCFLTAHQPLIHKIDSDFQNQSINSLKDIKYINECFSNGSQAIFTYGIMYCAIFLHAKPFGWIALCGNTPFHSADELFLLNLKGIYEIYLSSDKCIESNSNISNTILFRALLKGKADNIDLSPINNFASSLPQSANWNPYIVVIQNSPANEVQLPFLIDAINTMLTCCLQIIYQKSIVLLYYNRKQYPLSEHHNFIDFLKLNQLKCSISNTVDSLYNIPCYYEQAKVALQLGLQFHPKQALYFYENYASLHAIQVASHYLGIEQFRSTRLIDLQNYDKRKGTELVKTLRSYLTHLNDINSVAEDLCIHRNTLFYRLRKIESITGWTLNNGRCIDNIFFYLHVLDLITAQTE